MSSFAQIEELFLTAVDLPEEELEPWLQELAARENAEVAGQVRSMLRADSRADRRLESAIEDAAAGAAESASPQPGHQLGAYRLVSELGRGGMSTVFLATRSDDEFEQTVAVKVVRQGLAAPDLSKRLVAERQILARLSHPNIARLLDGGTTHDGMPFFVMEVIDGEPIDRFCDRMQLDIPSRIRLFQKVCQAVHFAHRHLVIHRDIKPSNVLVTDVEGARGGEPKLLDFGIAKLLDPASPMDITVSTYRLGTPGYTSPEQIQGLPITTASDTYSLGVLLYRLLTGESPYTLRDSAPIRDMEAAILDQQPRLPSSVARRVPVDTTTKRGEHPESLGRRLAGDLDNIVIMALRKEPERRYGSVEHFAEDLERYLSGLPVRARPDTFSYRTSKFLRRHRLGVLAVTSLIALTLAFVAALMRQETHTARQRDRAEQVSSLLVGLFEKVGPNPVATTISARDLLDLGREQIEGLEDQAETQANLRHTLGTLYEKMGIFEKAQELYELTAHQRQDLYGENHPLVAESLYYLGRACARAGDYNRAEPFFRRSLQLRQTLLGDDHPDVAVSLNSLALVLHEKGDYEGAVPIYSDALAMSERLNGPEHLQTIKTRSNFALLLLDRGHYPEAENLFRQAIESRQKLDGQSGEVIEALDGLAQSLVAQGKADEAEPISREVLKIRQKDLGKDHVIVARSLAHLADIVRLRDPDAAEALAREALAQRQHWLGDDNAETGESYAISASIQALKGDFASAEMLYRHAIDAYAKGLTPSHPMAARPVAELGVLLADQGKCEQAMALLMEAKEHLPAKDRRTAGVQAALTACRH